MNFDLQTMTIEDLITNAAEIDAQYPERAAAECHDQVWIHESPT